MSFNHAGGDAKCSCISNQCVPGSACPPARPPFIPPRPTATIPFSIAQAGAELGTDEQGNPQVIHFAGFGPVEYGHQILLQEGEWATGTITFREETNFGSAFVMPYNAVLKNIHVLFSSKYAQFPEPGSIYPFVCLAVSNSINLVYTILQDTITYTEPYISGFNYPKHTLRRGSLTNLNIFIPEGTLVAIVSGIRGVNVSSEQFARFTIAGGILLE